MSVRRNYIEKKHIKTLNPKKTNSKPRTKYSQKNILKRKHINTANLNALTSGTDNKKIMDLIEKLTADVGKGFSATTAESLNGGNGKDEGDNSSNLTYPTIL
jgi:hypothetical protein